MDHAPSLSNGHVRAGSPSNNVSPEPHSRAVGARSTFRVARGNHRHRRQGSGAPHPDEKVAVAQERVSKLEAALRAVGDDDDTAPNLREALKRARLQAVPLSIPDKVAQCESFLERARKREAAARELLLQAQTELTRLSADVVEGEQRLATFRAELERPQSPVVSVDMSAEVQRLRAPVEQLSKEKEDVCRCVVEEMQEWIQGRQKRQAAIVAGHFSEVARISQPMSSAAQEWQRIFQEQPAMPSAEANMVR